MMRTENTSDNNKRLLALGRGLKQAREAQEYSVAEVAERLFLSSNQVNAIEEAHYEKLPAEVFVKGYLRAYAKLLNLDPEAVVNEYQPIREEPVPRPEVVEPEEPEPPKRLFERIPDTSTTLVLGALSALVILFLVSLIYFATDTDSLPESEDPGQDEATEQLDQQSALGGESGVDALVDNFSDAAGHRALEMRFSDDCWVEVRDASRKILLADMRRAGDTEIVQGDPPYKVVLGKSHAVAVRFRGRSVPIRPDAGKLSAQLVIGG